MRDCLPTPRFVTVGVADGDSLAWRIYRTADFKVCGMRRKLITDDGLSLDQPRFREWRSCELADRYMDKLEDGTAGTGNDHAVEWIDEPPFFTKPLGRHVDFFGDTPA